MHLDTQLVAALLVFGLIALASRQIGSFFTLIHFPLVTGFLLTGIVAGPYVLEVVSAESLARVHFLDQIALGFIGFAAGAHLYLPELKSRFRTIRWVTLGQLVFTYTLSALALFLLAGAIPFMAELPTPARLAIALMGAAILVARSPSSAIAIINELRARGPFTRLVLGVTVTMDVIVILLFSISSSIADVLMDQLGFRFGLVLLVVAEIVMAAGLGVILGKVVARVSTIPANGALKGILLLACNYLVFPFSSFLHHWSSDSWAVEIFLEPLLVCMVAGFVVTNFSSRRTELHSVLDLVGQPVYVVFFTLVGASLTFGTLVQTWHIALLLFAVRLLAIFIGSVVGGMAGGDPWRLNRISWLTFVTQAGIGLGLAREVAVEFPGWGESFATMMIAVIIINQLVGPPLFKWALHMAGESHVRARGRDLRGVPVAFVFGLEGQSLALGRQLNAHGWMVHIVTRKTEPLEVVSNGEFEIVPVPDLSPASLEKVGAGKAQAFVSLMRDEENLEICQAAYERFGTQCVIVRSHDRFYWERYRALGATILDPGLAMVNLLDHFVRSPAAAALLLGMERGQDVVELVVSNPNLQGTALRDLQLPGDTLVLSVFRNRASLICHGYTRLHVGDHITIVGSDSSLEEIQLRFSDYVGLEPDQNIQQDSRDPSPLESVTRS
jgi:Trk K+ transport system NAD-binding subunit/Kef-type K+ transport system membrane component KefB